MLTSALKMDQQNQDRQLPTLKQSFRPGVTGPSEAPAFTFEPNLLRLKSNTSGFRVPNLTDSDEEELRLWEERIGKLESSPSAQPDTVDSQTSPASISLGSDIEHLSQLGDYTSLFSPNISVGDSPESHPKVEDAHYTSSPALANSSDRTSLSEYQYLKAPGDRNRRFRDPKTKANNMVVEREPPKSAAPLPPNSNQPAFANFQQPVFGKASPLQDRLQSNVFNIPKPHQARPEHHRPEPAGSSHLKQANECVHRLIDPFRLRGPVPPKSSQESSNHADVVEIPRPVDAFLWKSAPPATSTFSSFHTTGGFTSVNASNNSRNHVDLTTSDDPYMLDRGLLDDRFGAADPYNYVDPGKATENIKALLEGAFDDDEDKPRTRAQKKKLAEKLESLSVGVQQQKEDLHDAEEEEDDGTIEGLNVKLLPHQVDGVEWMKDKEIGKKKKNGILPKGGILADDVRSPFFIEKVFWC